MTAKTDSPATIPGKELQKITGYLCELDNKTFFKMLAQIIKDRGSEDLTFVISSLEIAQTNSAFINPSATQLKPLEKALKQHSLSFYLKQMSVELQDANRSHIIAWWDTLMNLAARMGYKTGGIDSISRETNLWKATAPLATKMTTDPGSYKYLPAVLINHPSEVDRVLQEINEPDPFVEVLTGESMEDLEKFPTLLAAFSIFDQKDKSIEEIAIDGMTSVHLILQRR